MDIPELAHVIEAILFVAGEPVNVREIQRALDVTEDETRQASSFPPAPNTRRMWNGFCSLSRSRAFPSPPWKP